jgi:transposase
MTTTATHTVPATTPERVLFMAVALREKTWQLGFPLGPGQQPRERAVAARHPARLLQEIAQAKRRCGLPETAPVVSWYAAGREGVWRPRFLPAQGSTTSVVDASSIAGNRRQRRAKSDGVDGRTLVRMWMRYAPGAGEVGRVGHVPSMAAEDQRHLHRDRTTRKQERASTTTRSKGLLRSQGGQLTRRTQLPAPLDAVRRWDGAESPSGRRRRWLRVWAPHECLRAQSAEWEAERRAVRHTAPAASIEKVRQLRQLRGSGSNGAGGLVRAFFAWRAWKNRREGGAERA